MHYDLTDLRLFLHVGETENLTRAARRAFLSLPAASTRIKQLEEAFQTPLLVRQAKGVRLTPAGATLLAHAREVFRELECLHSDLRPYAKGVKGRLRLLANTTATSSFLALALSRFLAENPDVDIELEEQLSQEIVSAIGAGAADLGIVAGEVVTDDLDAMHLSSDQLIVIAPTNAKLPLDGQHVRFADLLDTCRFVGLNQISAIQSFLDRIATGMGKRIRLRVQVGNFDAVCRMVQAGAGIAVLPASCARRYADSAHLRHVPLKDEWAQRELRLVRHPGRELPQFAQELVRHLVAAAREPA